LKPNHQALAAEPRDAPRVEAGAAPGSCSLGAKSNRTPQARCQRFQQVPNRFFAVLLVFAQPVDEREILVAGHHLAQLYERPHVFALSYALFEIPGGWLGD
jgi:hypothetical protein